jgi:ABC-type uncharacterized transport system ATPase subunit
MIAFLKDLNAREGVTIVVTSHDMDDLAEMARRILLLANGRVAFDGTFEALRVLIPPKDGEDPTLEEAVANLYSAWNHGG